MFFELAGFTSDPPIFLDFALKKHSPPLCAGGLVGWVGWVAGLAGLAGWLAGWVRKLISILQIENLCFVS